jgi:translation elongation factor EF-1beta
MDQQFLDIRDDFRVKNQEIGRLEKEIHELKEDHQRYRKVTIMLNQEAVQKKPYLKDCKANREDIKRVRFGLQDLNSNLVTTDKEEEVGEWRGGVLWVCEVKF